MKHEIWVLGATGRTGRAVAAQLHAAGVQVVLVGRERERLERVRTELGGEARMIVGPLDAALAQLTVAAPAVVVNTVGPFTATALKVARACPPGTHYVDVANELQAAQDILEMDRDAASSARTLVTGAGFGVLATESVVLRLCQGRPPALRVRVDAMASVATEPGVVGRALAATVVEAAALGGREVRGGRLIRSKVAGAPMHLTTPDGTVIGTASGATGELIAAWRASRAETVVAASNIVPTSAAARLVLPALSALIRLPAVGRWAVHGLARLPLQARDRPRPSSWGHARVEWRSGDVLEGWFRTGDAMTFTAAVTAQVAQRLARGEGRPGAYTPGALFGAELALDAGGEFLDHR